MEIYGTNKLFSQRTEDFINLAIALYDYWVVCSKNRNVTMMIKYGDIDFMLITKRGPEMVASDDDFDMIRILMKTEKIEC